tara:strand:- start:5 stop:736 length:732 start_codon:yes stop_codon:yes gene_type:complete
MKHLLDEQNFALSVSRQNKGGYGYSHVFCHKGIAESSLISNKTSEISSSLPLYLTGQGLDQTRRINFDPELFQRIKDLSICDKSSGANEIEVFDYIYGVLHCPKYRETFAEFLAIDFPRIPWPKTPDEFWDISKKGSCLRKLHLMDAGSISHVDRTFYGEGNNLVSKIMLSEEKVWINDKQYFDNVSDLSWSFFIGAYQPAQKWLKDRKGKQLSSEEIMHYQNILKILDETSQVMNSIDMDFG